MPPQAPAIALLGHAYWLQKFGGTIAQANAAIARLLPVVLQSFPASPGFGLQLFENARIAPALRSMRDDIVGDAGGVLGVVMAGIGFVLLIARAGGAWRLVRVDFG